MIADSVQVSSVQPASGGAGTMSALPEIAVSAADQSAADAFVADLINTDAHSEVNEGETADMTRVWHLLTKYYRAQVRVRVRLDAAPVLQDGDGASGTTEAHVIYLTENECSSALALERRVEHGAAASVEVRVVACDVTASAVSDALSAAARAHDYELITLRAPAAAGGDDDDEPWGVPAVRDALYAHLWPNLQRLDDVFMVNGLGTAAADELQWSDSDSEAEGAGGGGGAADDDEPDVADSLQRAERLMAALAGVAAVRAANQPLTSARGPGAAAAEHEQAADDAAWRAQRAERLRRAEDLLAAFTRALR